jgi:hypothetical protein
MLMKGKDKLMKLKELHLLLLIVALLKNNDMLDFGVFVLFF